MSSHAPANTSTGIPNAKLGIWSFLASEVMLFGGLLSAYVILNTGSAHMITPPRSMMGVPLATLNTLVLITSSVAMVLALSAIQENNVARFKQWMYCVIGGAGIFLAIKAYEYNHKWHEGITISSNLFGSFYYTLTGLHALHIIGGIIALSYILYEGAKGRYGPDNFDRVECVGLYWHFVDLVWVLLFPILYLL